MTAEVWAPGVVTGPATFVDLVENQLGWFTEKGWKGRVNEASRVKKKVATDPVLYSWANLVLAVEYLRRKRQAVKSPVAVCWFVREALEQAYLPEASTLTSDVALAIADEQAHQLEDWSTWVARLTRASGPARAEVLSQREAARL